MNRLVLVGLLFCACKSSPSAALLDGEVQKAQDLRSQGKQAEGITLLTGVREQALKAGLGEVATRALNRRGDLHHDLGHTDEATADYQAAYAEAEKRQDLNAMGRAAHDLGLMSGTCGGGEDSALDWYRKALAARRQANDLKGVRVTANNLAIKLFYRNQEAEAVPLYEEALRAAEATDDVEGLLKVHANLALLYALKAEVRAEPTADEPAPLPTLDREQDDLARAHFAKAVAAGARLDRDEAETCGSFGSFGDRCERLSPRLKPGEALVRFYGQLAAEADAEEPVLDPEMVEGANLARQLQVLKAARLCMKAADTARALGPEWAAEADTFDERAKTRLTSAIEKTTEGKMPSLVCGLRMAKELCARYLRPSNAKDQTR